jgi:hypothetical protein
MLAAEEEWILENISKDKYNDDKAALECFVGDLRPWGRGVLAIPGGEKNAEVKI